MKKITKNQIKTRYNEIRDLEQVVKILRAEACVIAEKARILKKQLDKDLA